MKLIYEYYCQVSGYCCVEKHFFFIKYGFTKNTARLEISVLILMIRCSALILKLFFLTTDNLTPSCIHSISKHT